MKRRDDIEARDKRVRVVVIGSGNVAESLALNLARNGCVDLCQIYARNGERGRELADMAGTVWTDKRAELAAAEIYIIAVSDRSIGDVAASLPFAEDAIVVHTAGSVPLSVLPERGGRRGILYAFQSFSRGRDIRLDEVPIFIEAERDDVRDQLTDFARCITSRVEYADSERRRVIHLAGVVVNNFVNALYGEAMDIVSEAGLDFEILKPLILETAAKAVASHNPRSVQTGPAVRNDREVCGKHIEMLRHKPQLQRIYNELTELIWETSKRI